MKTKFKLGQEVWFIRDNAIMQSKIYAIDICINSKLIETKSSKKSKIFKIKEIRYDTGFGLCSNEHKLFASKQQLLKTL